MRRSDVPEVQRQLLQLGHADDGGVTLMTHLVELLRARGLPLWRCSFSLITKHPELVWRSVQWHEAEGVKTIDRNRETLADPYFTQSPIALLRQGAPPIRVPLGDGPLPFPICADLRAQGATEYFAQGLLCTTGEICFVSWATRAPGGFGDEAVAALTELSPYLAPRIELASAYHATSALLEVYLGRNAGRRVAQGGFRRGGGELIDAAIWFCDMRDFTALADRRSPEAVVATLDEYFDLVGGAVMAAGGEVLKFIGDAILAIFPIAPAGSVGTGAADARAAGRSALAAAEQALAALATQNAARAARGDEALAIGVALHLGRVMYGNIGARDRLDFTVISSSVNEASRLEALCKLLGTPLTLSQAFVAAVQPDGVIDLGEHTLKGVRAPVRVFTLARARPPA